jgi:DNA-binding MurR/RpiR family transcriptional regulator
MSTTMQAVGEYVLRHPEAVTTMPIDELGRLSHTSPATVTRFARLMGFGGYVAFRTAIAVDLATSSATKGLGWTHPSGDGLGLQGLLDRTQRELVLTAESLDFTVIDRVSATLARSRSIDIYAYGASTAAAGILHAGLYNAGLVSHHWSDPGYARLSGLQQGRATTAVALSRDGDEDWLVRQLGSARLAGATTVALTPQHSSPLARCADMVIAAPYLLPHLDGESLEVIVAQLFVVGVLVSSAAAKAEGK